MTAGIMIGFDGESYHVMGRLPFSICGEFCKDFNYIQYEDFEAFSEDCEMDYDCIVGHAARMN